MANSFPNGVDDANGDRQPACVAVHEIRPKIQLKREQPVGHAHVYPAAVTDSRAEVVALFGWYGHRAVAAHGAE